MDRNLKLLIYRNMIVSRRLEERIAELETALGGEVKS